MQKIYVLLRNDKQTGPYSLQELIQFNLKPYDLIWIEGKSAGWYYPQEIGALQPYLRFLPQKPKPAVQSTTTAKPVLTSTPPAKEEPQLASSFAENVYQPIETTKVARASKTLEEEVYAQFQKPFLQDETIAATTAVPASPKKKAPSSGLLAFASILVVGGVFAASWLMNRHSTEENAALPEAVAPVQNEITPAAVAANDNTQKENHFFTAKQKQQKGSALARQTTRGTKQKAAVKQQEDETARYPVTEPGNGETVLSPKEETPVVSQEEAGKETKEVPQEKKKSLRDKFFDLFRKKPAEQKTEEAKPVENTNGERKATRREETADLTEAVSIRLDVPNNWMMGIKGAKAILVNRSRETLSKATVEILYYNDDNELLQKKTVTFGKVEGKESKSVSIPDHATATRLEYNVLSVTGDSAA